MQLFFPISVLGSNLQLTNRSIELLHLVSGVDRNLLRNVKISPSSANVLRVPWYSPYKGGGGITIGQTIYFTANWFAENRYKRRDGRNVSYGNNEEESVLMWLKLLSHEVGHLPQAKSFGFHSLGKFSYILFFTKGYLGRALMFKKRVHDGFSGEITADLGQYVFTQLFTQKNANGSWSINADGKNLIQHFLLSEDELFYAFLEKNKPKALHLQSAYKVKYEKHFLWIERKINVR